MNRIETGKPSATDRRHFQPRSDRDAPRRSLELARNNPQEIPNMPRHEAHSENTDHIAVCVCTYKRPELLMRLLQALCKQRTDGLADYSIVVVDNDYTESGREIVRRVKETSPIDVTYHCEPERNISLARNRAIAESRGNFIAFIDDDEVPPDDWLLTLYKAIRHFRADGVLGPVKPYFPVQPPKWIARGKFFDRRSLPTGTVLNDRRHVRTGNVLLGRTVFNADEAAFDPRFGRTGGGDVDFFKRKIASGYLFVWCDEAAVYEAVPAERLTRAYLLKRALLRGVSEAMLGRVGTFNVGKSLVAIALYTTALPLLFVAGHQHFMKFLIKDCDHLGKLLAACGIALVKERTF